MLTIEDEEEYELRLAESNLRFKRCLTAFSMRDWSNAITNLRQIILLGPREGLAYCMLTTALRRSGSYDEAVNVGYEAIRRFPNLADAYRELGDALRCQKEFEKAISHIEMAISLNPRDSDNYCAIAQAYYENNQFLESVAALQKAEELSPNTSYIPHLRGRVYLRLKKGSQANQALMQARKFGAQGWEIEKQTALAQLYRGYLPQALFYALRALIHAWRNRKPRLSHTAKS